MNIDTACTILGVEFDISDTALLELCVSLVSDLNKNISSDVIIINIIIAAYSTIKQNRTHMFQQRTGEFYYDRVN